MVLRGLLLSRLAPVVKEWGLDAAPDWFNESWTFILDSDGRIRQQFEGFSTLEELEAALQVALAQG